MVEKQRPFPIQGIFWIAGGVACGSHVVQDHARVQDAKVDNTRSHCISCIRVNAECGAHKVLGRSQGTANGVIVDRLAGTLVFGTEDFKPATYHTSRTRDPKLHELRIA